VLTRSTALLLRLLAVLYAVLGCILCFAPHYAAAQFAWRVEPLVAMTFGGWCLGNAMFAWEAARLAHWSKIGMLVSYLGVFGIGQAYVVWLFQGAIRWQGTLTWPYLALLGLNVLIALATLVDRLKMRPAIEGRELPMRTGSRVLGILFVLLVGFLAYRGSIAKAGGLSTEGGIFPTKLTLFSVRAFAAFYLALAVSALPVLWSRSAAAWTAYARCGMVFIVTITGAALLHLEQFDFAQRPGGYVYLGVYGSAFIGAAIVLLFQRSQDNLRPVQSIGSTMRF
jgi:hypothetical protein